MPPFQEIILLSGVFRRETASGFYPWGNALPQDCFLCFCFLIPFTIRQQCIIYPPKFSTGPNSCQKSFLLLKKMRFFYIFCRFCWIFSFSCVYLWYLFKVNQPANVPT